MRWWFPFKSLRTGLMLTYLFLIASSLGLMAWRVGASLNASRFAETQRDQEGRAILAASATGDWLGGYQEGRISRSMLQAEVAGLSRQISQPATILDRDGKVIVDAEHPDEEDHDDSSAPEVAAALSGRVANAIRHDPDDIGDVLFTIAPVNYNHTLVGFVRLELPMKLVDEASQQFWLRIIAATALAALVTAMVSFLLARALTEPLARIRLAATALAHGDLKQRIQVAGPDELKQLANGFNFMAERIEHVMEDQRAFVANAAHELRTPLTTIRLRAEVLADGAKDDPEVSARFLGDIISETDRLSRLVGQLLDLSRIETNLVTPRRVPVSLRSIAQAVMDELTPRITATGIRCSIDAADNLPAVNADSDQLRQVLINLLGNALKFTPTNGKIDLQIRFQRQPRANDRLPAGDWLLMSVIDNGAGIPPDDLSHVFDRFYRGDKSRESSEQNSGTGLGLAIVKSIIDAHGGHIWVTSQPGKGTNFSLALPVNHLT